jgi:hypothetical protein
VNDPLPGGASASKYRTTVVPVNNPVPVASSTGYIASRPSQPRRHRKRSSRLTESRPRCLVWRRSRCPFRAAPWARAPSCTAQGLLMLRGGSPLAPHLTQERGHVAGGSEPIDRASELGVVQSGGCVASAVTGVTPYPTPRVRKRSRGYLQFSCCGPEEARSPGKIEPDDGVSGSESNLRDRPVIAGDDPSVTVDQLRMLRHLFFIRGKRRLTPVVVVKVEHRQVESRPEL